MPAFFHTEGGCGLLSSEEGRGERKRMPPFFFAGAAAPESVDEEAAATDATEGVEGEEEEEEAEWAEGGLSCVLLDALLTPKGACGVAHADCCDFGCGAAVAGAGADVDAVVGGWCVGRTAGWSCTMSPSVATHTSMS